MSVYALVARMTTEGFEFGVTGEKLRIKPFSRLTPEAHAELKEQRAKILLLFCLCPFCHRQITRCEQISQDDIYYFEIRCTACGEVAETYIPAQQTRSQDEMFR